MNNKPLKTFKTGISNGMQIAVWEGNKPGTHYVTITKSYKKSDGSWARSNSYFAADIAAISLLAPQVIAFLESVRGPAPTVTQTAPRQVQTQVEPQQPQPGLFEEDDDDIPF